MIYKVLCQSFILCSQDIFLSRYNYQFFCKRREFGCCIAFFSLC